jgi:hypothetical protein
VPVDVHGRVGVADLHADKRRERRHGEPEDARRADFPLEAG